MTKADLLILQDAAEEFSLESAENLGVNKSVCLQTAALAILCRVVSDLMAGEGDRWTKKMIDERDQVIANEAWNAALQAGIDYVKEIVGDQATAKLNAFEVYAALNTLRKEPS